ncbi:helix-turn-helix domain-containing protein [Yinghuangia aomiensis]
MSSVKEIQSVKNACLLLEELARRQPVGVSDLARSIGMDKSAVHRLAVTLGSTGWLRRTADGRWYFAPGSSPCCARPPRHRWSRPRAR